MLHRLIQRLFTAVTHRPYFTGEQLKAQAEGSGAR